MWDKPVGASGDERGSGPDQADCGWWALEVARCALAKYRRLPNNKELK